LSKRLEDPTRGQVAYGGVRTVFYTGTTYLTSYGASSTGGAPSHTPVLSLGILAAAAMALAVVVSAISSDHLGGSGVIMAACASVAVWSLLLFLLPGTHSPAAFAIALIVAVGLQGLGYGPRSAVGCGYPSMIITGSGGPPRAAGDERTDRCREAR
jgi:hypothetical protein